MSASLVGSEMCIRDSASTASAKRAGRSGFCAASLLRASCGGRTRMPVSYTHLTLPTICSG
eukprot:5842591-Alexandrium_andersonii.AAC.1